jgi:ACR3 family arsenite efflux pump ArsB
VTISLTKQPAVLLALLAALANAIVAAVEAGSVSGAFNITTALLVGIPLVAGVLTRFSVVPVETVREAIAGARSASAAVTDLANRVELSTADRPADS